MAAAFVTISIDRNGEIQRVKRGRVAVPRKSGAAARKALGAGARVVKRVRLEFLIHREQTKKRGSGKRKGKGKGKGGTDPCESTICGRHVQEHGVRFTRS